jgi:osmotically-inducible protein OsmY
MGAGLVKMTLAAAVGAALAYSFDPVRGRRRRAEMRDRGRSFAKRELRAVERQANYRKGRAEGLVHRLRHPESEAPDDDLTLVDKVRSEALGRAPGRGPHLTVDACDRVVTLRGEVPDVDAALDIERRVREVAGVDDVVNLLHSPGTPAPNKIDALKAES